MEENNKKKLEAARASEEGLEEVRRAERRDAYNRMLRDKQRWDEETGRTENAKRYLQGLVESLDGVEERMRLIDVKNYKGCRIVLNKEDEGVSVEELPHLDAEYARCPHCDYQHLVVNIMNYCSNCGKKWKE